MMNDSLSELKRFAKDIGEEALLESMLNDKVEEVKVKAKVIRVTCPHCKNSFKSKKKNNHCRKCNQYFET